MQHLEKLASTLGLTLLAAADLVNTIRSIPGLQGVFVHNGLYYWRLNHAPKEATYYSREQVAELQKAQPAEVVPPAEVTPPEVVVPPVDQDQPIDEEQPEDQEPTVDEEQSEDQGQPEPEPEQVPEPQPATARKKGGK